MNPRETRILLVDDDPIVREMMEYLLQAGDYCVETAENGLSALEKYRRGPRFHLVVTDMNMPVMDGPTLIRELRSLDAQVAILLLTGNEDGGGAAGGADGCVIKDENLQDTIVARVESLLGKRK